jgi:hypothetical protein
MLCQAYGLNTFNGFLLDVVRVSADSGTWLERYNCTFLYP